jgi:hypothetical protein
MGGHNLIPSILLKCHVQPLPLSFPFSFFSSPSFHARHSFLSLSLLSSFFFSPTPTHETEIEIETEIETKAETERERESCCMEEEKRERRNGFLEKLRPVGINDADQCSSMVRWS